MDALIEGLKAIQVGTIPEAIVIAGGLIAVSILIAAFINGLMS